jgi:putative sigma-54 modulation protein
MKFEYSGRHIEVTPALKAHVEGHFKRIDHIFNGKPIKAHVIIEVERGRHRSEIVVNWRNDSLTATSSVSDMYKSLSDSIAKIEKQALKLKNKVIDRAHKAKKAGSIGRKVTDIKPSPTMPRIIGAKRYAVKPMATDEAAMQLADQVDQFLVFRNAKNDKVSVIYKRKDGNYGLIQP